jgi:hypothetical protein
MQHRTVPACTFLLLANSMQPSPTPASDSIHNDASILYTPRGPRRHFVLQPINLRRTGGGDLLLPGRYYSRVGLESLRVYVICHWYHPALHELDLRVGATAQARDIVSNASDHLPPVGCRMLDSMSLHGI